MQKINSVWGKLDGSGNKAFWLRGGRSDIRFKKVLNSWLFRIEDGEELSPNLFFAENGDGDFTDADIYQIGKSSSISIRPALPSKPLVFRSSSKIGISPGQSLQLFIKVPITVQFYTNQGKNESLILEHSLQRLPDTWFGEPDSGEPAFSIGSHFAFKPEDMEALYFEAICPLNIHNNSTQILEIQRLIVHVEYMNLYGKKEQLYTDTAFIEYKGADLVGNIEFAPDKKLLGDSFTKIGSSRQTLGKSILGKSFHYIKKLT